MTLSQTTVSFESLDPRSGEVVGEHAVHDAEAVAAAVDRAREAARWWADLGFAGRRAGLRAWRRELARRFDDLAALITAETGKPRDDARLELVLALEHLDWAAANAEKVLGPRRVAGGTLSPDQAATLRYAPLGVVGVIGPWNYPLFTPMGSIAYALAAGNAVVFKPSELTPGVGEALAASLAAVSGGRALLQVVTGFGETGTALCRAGVDKIAFTGSGATARRVLAACAETLTPAVVECGGKDALLVDADADLAAAAEAAVWAGVSNNGQTCVGVERVYVHAAVADEFLGRVRARAQGLRPGVDFGPFTMPGQDALVRAHVADAVDRGGKLLVGELGHDGVAVVSDVPEDSRAVTEETFGPLLVVNRVHDMAEAVERANATAYGLGAAVFSRSRGEDIAARLRCGMVSVNDVIAFAGIPSLPFGGVGESGFGRIHGADGLREFARSQAITRKRFASPVQVTTFARSPRLMTTLATAVRWWHRRT